MFGFDIRAWRRSFAVIHAFPRASISSVFDAEDDAVSASKTAIGPNRDARFRAIIDLFSFLFGRSIRKPRF